MGRGHAENSGIGQVLSQTSVARGGVSPVPLLPFLSFVEGDVSMVEGVVRVGKGRVSVGLD